MGDPQVTNDLDDLGYPQDWGNLQFESQHVSKAWQQSLPMVNEMWMTSDEFVFFVRFFQISWWMKSEWNLNELLVIKATV